MLSDLRDLPALSSVLDQALFLLANSPARFRASELSRAIGIHSSVLTRMKLLHANPKYEALVSRYLLANVLKYLLECFPTLVIRQHRDGRIVVHLYKKYGGFKFDPLPLPGAQLFRRNPPKPGSTRWYLEQMETNPPLAGQQPANP